MSGGVMPTLEAGRGDRCRAVGTDDLHAAVGRVGTHPGGVGHRNALGDDDDEAHSGVDGLHDGALGEGGRDEDDAHLGAGGLLGLGDGAVDGDLDGFGLDLAGSGGRWG